MITRLAGLLLALPFAATAQDADEGRVLYQTYCGGCHYERVHQRLRTEVRDLSELRDMVVQYLNETHYRFGLAPRSKP